MEGFGWPRTGTLQTVAGANLLCNLAAARWKLGDLPGALEDSAAACEAHRLQQTLHTPSGQAALKQNQVRPRAGPRASQ